MNRVFPTLLLFFVFSILHTHGQVSEILIKDAKTGLGVAYAHLIVDPQPDKQAQVYLTNDKGLASLTFADSLSIQISVVGYQSITQTIRPQKYQEIEIQPSNFNVKEVVITGQLEPQPVDQSIYKIKIIDSKEIESKAAVNIPDLIATDLKFRTFSDGILGSSLSIQGLSGNNVKILVDGVPVIGREGGNVDLSQLNLYNVDHIEVVEGPFSVLYGNNSLAGAINIITKENKYTRFKSQINAYYESVGRYNADGLISFRKKNSSYTFSGGRNFTQERDLDPNLRSTLWKPKEQYLADASYTYDKGNTKLKLSTSLLRELMIDKGTPRPPYGEIARDVYLTTWRQIHSINYEYRLRDDHLLSFLSSFSNYSRINEDFLKDLTTLDMRSVELDTTLSDNWVFRGEWRNFGKDKIFNYHLGYDINLESGKGEKINDGARFINDYALFWSAQFNQLRWIQIQPGLRYSFNTQFSTPLVPSINFKISPNAWWDVRLSYVRGFRSPTIKELFLDFQDTNHNLFGNPDLEPEFGHNYNVSFNLNTERWHKLHYSNFKIDFFYNSMWNKIELGAINPEELHYSYVNIARYGTMGGFAQFDYRFHPYLNFSVGYGNTSYLTSTDGESLNYDSIQSSNDVTSSLAWSILSWNSDVSLFYKYNGQLPRFTIDENNQMVFDFLKPFHTLDISFNSSFFQNRLKTSVGVRNVFNNYIVEQTGSGGAAHVAGAGMPISMGRTLFVKLSYHFNRY